MGTRIIGLKAMKDNLRRLQYNARRIPTVSERQLCTQIPTDKLSQNTEILRLEESAGDSGRNKNTFMSLGVGLGAGAAAYYYWNENKRGPFGWIKGKTTETDTLDVDLNRMIASTKKTEGNSQAFDNSFDTFLKSASEAQISIQSTPFDLPIGEPLENHDNLGLENFPSVSSISVAVLENPGSTQVSVDLEAIKLKYEKDLLKALARQAQVYKETHDQAVNVLKTEFERKLKIGSELLEAERMIALRSNYGQAIAELTALEQVVKGRLGEELTADRARRLWTYCNFIYHQINYTTPWDSLSFPKAISVCKTSLLRDFHGDPLVTQLLNAIPDAIENTENLRVRFFDVIDSNCRHTAIFKSGETITFWKYFLGMVQESLMTKCEGKMESVSTTFEILDRTAFHLKRGELLEAVYMLNRLDGLPREICQEWLTDARTVLEVNQAISALMTYATASNNFMYS